MTLRPAIPHVFVTAFADALSYYTGPLGFRALFTYGEPPHYAHVARDQAVLALREVPRSAIDRGAGIDLLSAFIEVDDADALHTDLRGAGAVIHQPPRDEPWGMRSVIASDPEGNLLCFASTLPPAAVGPRPA